MSEVTKPVQAEVKRIEAEADALRAAAETQVNDDWHKAMSEAAGWPRRYVWGLVGVVVIAAVIVVWLLVR